MPDPARIGIPQEAVRLLAEGRSPREVAEQLGLSLRSVGVYAWRGRKEGKLPPVEREPSEEDRVQALFAEGKSRREVREALGIDPKVFLRFCYLLRKKGVDVPPPEPQESIYKNVIAGAQAGEDAYETAQRLNISVHRAYEYRSRARKQGLLPPPERQEREAPNDSKPTRTSQRNRGSHPHSGAIRRLRWALWSSLRARDQLPEGPIRDQINQARTLLNEALVAAKALQSPEPPAPEDKHDKALLAALAKRHQDAMRAVMLARLGQGDADAARRELQAAEEAIEKHRAAQKEGKTDG